jgi:hypothetical protein
MLASLLIAGFLVGHATVHLGFVSPTPPATAGGPPWPFSTAQSWLVTRFGVRPGTARGIAVALVTTTIAGFTVAGLVALGVLPESAWVPSVAIGAVASLASLIVFFHPWLLLGVAIDLGLLWVAVIHGWVPTAPGLGG